MARILKFEMNGKGFQDMTNPNLRDRADAIEWLEDMGFVMESEEKPQTNSEPMKHEPAA